MSSGQDAPGASRADSSHYSSLGKRFFEAQPPKNLKLGNDDTPLHGESEGTVRRTVSKDAVRVENVSKS